MGGLLSYSLSVSVFILMLYPVLHQIINRSRHFRFNRLAVITGHVPFRGYRCTMSYLIQYLA